MSAVEWNTTRRDSAIRSVQSRLRIVDMHEERNHERVYEAAHAPGVRVDPIEQQRIGEEIEVEDERRRESQAERLHVPARVLRQVAEQLLDQHETEHSQREAVEDREPDRAPRKTSAGTPARSAQRAPITTSAAASGTSHVRPPRRGGLRRRSARVASATAGMRTTRRCAARRRMPRTGTAGFACVSANAQVDDRPDCREAYCQRERATAQSAAPAKAR